MRTIIHRARKMRSKRFVHTETPAEKIEKEIAKREKSEKAITDLKKQAKRKHTNYKSKKFLRQHNR